ncbi:MAG: sigma-70 family RNA polymerase sigma factor [Phycisphaerales bacterium]|nr:sigma-70 family RNA polymerase sigma factor [Phycisphaerales bacterium]
MPDTSGASDTSENSTIGRSENLRHTHGADQSAECDTAEAFDDSRDITDAVESLIGSADLQDEDTDRAFRERAAVDRMKIIDVWHAYKKTGEGRYRDRLVEHYMRTHVRRIAARLSSSLPSQVDVDDLTQQGYLGLAESIERYDLDRMAQVKFETFSSHRIFGAMQDYLRAIDPVPRLTRWRSKQMQGIIDQFITENGRPPSVDEIRGLVDLPDPQFKRMFDDMRPAAMVSFSAAAADGDEFDSDGDAMGSFEDPQSGTPLSTVERDDLRSWVTRGLARRDRLIVVLYYYEQLTMKEVGRTVGCSESRVSQRIESIRDCLKSRFVDVELEDEFLFV